MTNPATQKLLLCASEIGLAAEHRWLNECAPRHMPKGCGITEAVKTYGKSALAAEILSKLLKEDGYSVRVHANGKLEFCHHGKVLDSFQVAVIVIDT